ncbi:hypothetical protein UB23_06405 [Pseudomonas sp. ES3-33]|nr:hypothetical protein UB23_06405 [Pseudomonas sp. ES3-33]
MGMHASGSATRRGLVKYRNEVPAAFVGSVAQRILPSNAWSHMYVDMCPGRERRQFSTVGSQQFEAADTSSFRYFTRYINFEHERNPTADVQCLKANGCCAGVSG